MAQTIATNSLSVSIVCTGSSRTLSIPFSTTGTFASGNVFIAQLSDVNGTFSGTVATIGTLAATPSGTYTGAISASIPTTLTASANYRIRIIASAPARTSTNTQSFVIQPTPGLPSVTVPSPYCASDLAKPLTATATTGGTLNWYGTNASGLPTTTTSTPDTKLIGTTPYYVSQTVNGCISEKAAIPVVVNSRPSVPVITNKSYCVGDVASALSATGISGATLNWYGSPVSGTALSTAPTPGVAVAGSTAYYVSQTINGCESSRATLVVSVNTRPAAPRTVTPTPICQGATTPALTATALFGATLRWWGTSSSGGSFSTTSPTPTTQTSATYYVSQVLNNCESPRSAIAVTINPTPAVPAVVSSLSYCQNITANPLSATASSNATLNWYGANQTGGTASSTATTPGTGTSGTTMYYVSQTSGNCESQRASISIQVRPSPTAPTVTSPVIYCQNRQATPLTASPTAGGTLVWYGTNATGGTASATAPTPTLTATGSTTYYASQTLGGCEGPRVGFVVTVNPTPAAPSVANLSYCQAQKDQPAQAIPALTATGQNLRWYNPDGNTYASAPTPPISQSGTFSVQVTQTVNNCESDKATIQVAVQSVAAPTVPKSVVTYCVDGKSVPLEATGQSGNILHWVDPYGRDMTSAPTPPTLNVNVQPGGDSYYVYQVSPTGCYSARSTIRVIVNAIPTLSLTGSTAIYLGQKAPLRLTFTANPPFSYTITGGYTGLSNTTDTTIFVLPRGATTTYQVSAVTNSCGLGLPGNPATAIVTAQVPTITTSAVNATTLCAGTSLAVPFTTTGIFINGNAFKAELISVADTSKRYEISSGTAASPITATVSGTLASGRYYIRVSGSNPDIGILGSISPTILTIRSKPTATLTGNQSVNLGAPAKLTIAFGGDSPWAVTYADSVQSYSASTSVNPYMVEVRPTRTTTYKLVSVSNGCGSGTISGTATINVMTVLGVEDTTLDPLVQVYPIPTATTVMVDIDLPLTRDQAVLSITTMRGLPIRQLTTRTHHTEIDLSNQPAGIYLLRIQIGDRQSVRKIVKQ
ncbi:Ig-like domain-containing protein [Spirosoma agri]|nr:T9SS type A sorting domain-containing protein [Spirosoma agri]